MKSKLGIICIILGVVLISGALFLTLYNMHQENAAQEAVESIMPQLMEQIEVNKENNPTSPENENDHDLELKVPVELLTEEDKKMAEIEIDGYPYIGYLSMPTIGRELPILADWDYDLLKKAHEEGRINFIGNMEGREVLSGAADVLVCDGFTGNVLMKTIEGTAGFIMKELKNIMYANLPSKLAALVLKPGLTRLKNMMDYKTIGGVPLLGVSKPVIKAHGSSDARAFCSACEQAMLFAHSGFIGRVEENIAYMTVGKEEA